MHTYQFAVFGHPIAQSRSPDIHALFAKQAGFDVNYVKIDPGSDGFADGIQAFKANGGYGFNVTMPFKQQAYQCVDALSLRAASARAVNTVKIDEDGRMFGDNTDGDGLVNALQQDLTYTVQGKTVLILGAGGAVQGILPALLAQKPRIIYVMNRTLAKAEQLVQAIASLPSPLPSPLTPLSLAGAGNNNHRGTMGTVFPLALDVALTCPIDLLINAVAFQHLILPENLSFAPKALAYDLSYGAVTKPFTDWAITWGATQVSDGLSMLVCQAALAFELWTGFAPDVAPVLAALQ
jgi:shikimate dehydrogenase